LEGERLKRKRGRERCPRYTSVAAAAVGKIRGSERRVAEPRASSRPRRYDPSHEQGRGPGQPTSTRWRSQLPGATAPLVTQGIAYTSTSTMPPKPFTPETITE
jgi:hypothetical protein